MPEILKEALETENPPWISVAAIAPTAHLLKKSMSSTFLDDNIVKPVLGEETGLPDGVLAPALAAGGYAAIKVQDAISEGYRRLSTGTIPLTDPRAMQAAALVLRGQASVDELLKASYGEWPPKGLEIVRQNPQMVHFDSIMRIAENLPGPDTVTGQVQKEWKALTQINGAANQSGPREMRLNHFRLGFMPALTGYTGLPDAMGHEVTHTLQGDYHARAIGASKDPDLRQAIGDRDVLFYPSDATSRAFFSHTDHNLLAQWDNRTLGLFDELRDSTEIQARIHQIMAHGYQSWKQLPTSTEQFLVAMQSSGLRVPKEVMDTLDSSPTLAEARRLFPPVASHPASGDINLVQYALTPEGQKIFWNESMPALYGHLLENYGDGPGRARMGLGENILASLPGKDIPHSAEIPAVKSGGRYTGSLIQNAVVGTVVAAGTLALGGTLEDSLNGAAASTLPYYDAGQKALAGDREGAKQSAITETFALAAGVGVSLAGAPVAATAAVTMVAHEAAVMAYQTPERLETARQYAERKEQIVSRFSDYAKDIVSGHLGKPAEAKDIVRALEDPDMQKAVEKALRDDKQGQDLETLNDFRKTDEEYSDAMKKYGVHDSLENRAMNKAVDRAYEYGF